MYTPLVSVPVGTRFGRWVVLKEAPSFKSNSNKLVRRFKVKCDCGTERIVELGSLRARYSVSCGCYQYERSKEVNTKHGLTQHPLYNVWFNMLARCHDKNDKGYKNYGGRGIKVCREWRGEQGVSNFVKWAEKSGYSPGLQIDRRDNDKGYSPNNCWFTTPQQNSRNKRTSIMVFHKGEKVRFIKLWEKQGVVSYGTAIGRLRRGWEPLRAVKTPVP